MTDLFISLRYKLRIIGEPIEGAAIFFYGNEYVYKNASFDESQLKKKFQAICFHQASECMAFDIIIVHNIYSSENIDDLLKNSLPGWKCVQLITHIMYLDNPNIS